MKIINYNDYLHLDIDGELVWSYGLKNQQFLHKCTNPNYRNEAWNRVYFGKCYNCSIFIPKHIKYLFLLQTLNLPKSLTFTEIRERYPLK